MDAPPEPLVRLRAAADAVAALDGDRGGVEPGELDAALHADRFAALHEAMVAVLADVDRS